MAWNTPYHAVRFSGTSSAFATARYAIRPSGSTPSHPRTTVRRSLRCPPVGPRISVAGRGAGAAGAIGARPSVREIGPLSPRDPRHPTPSPASARAGGDRGTCVRPPVAQGRITGVTGLAAASQSMSNDARGPEQLVPFFLCGAGIAAIAAFAASPDRSTRRAGCRS